jgi:hypothetical protein
MNNEFTQQVGTIIKKKWAYDPGSQIQDYALSGSLYRIFTLMQWHINSKIRGRSYV